MERLTKRKASGAAGHAYTPDCYFGDGRSNSVAKSAFRQGCLERLADYEDTGLTPAEVRSMHGEWTAMMSVLNSIGGYDRLRELAEADKAGRVMVLKCKPGDTVYFIKAVFQWAKEPIEAKITGMTYYGNECMYIADKTGWTQVKKFLEKEIGKTVFLTREEAKKALEEAKHGN